MKFFIPDIDKDFFCIVSSDQPQLAAAISSYLIKPNFYLPMFEFPSVTKEKDNYENIQIDENSISRNNGMQFNVEVGNSLRRIGGCNYLILVGLSAEQKSYLTFLQGYNTIEINSFTEIDFHFGGHIENRINYTPCSNENYLEALYYAASINSKLKIDGSHDIVPCVDKTADGIIIVAFVGVPKKKYAVAVCCVWQSSKANTPATGTIGK
jgi:hypothetical protein